MSNLVFKKITWWSGLGYILFFLLLFTTTFFVYPIFYPPVPDPLPLVPPAVNAQGVVPLSGQVLNIAWSLMGTIGIIVLLALLFSILFKPRFKLPIFFMILILFIITLLPIFSHDSSCVILRWQFCF